MLGSINVYFYGELAVHVSMNQIAIPMQHSRSVADVKHLLAHQFANWHSYTQPIYNVINRELVDDDAVVNVGDNVAFFPAMPALHQLAEK